MGGTVNATDNFKAPEATTEEIVEAIESGKGAVLNEQNQVVVLDSLAQVTNEGHVHGPGCGHDHEAPKEPPKGKYLTPLMIPALDLKASFENNLEGPIWRKTPQELLTNIAFHAAHVTEGGVKLCFVNNEAYKFLLALPGFRKQFTPASAAQQKTGVVGLFGTHVVMICDALWDQGEQLTLHKAIYFCDEVLAPVTEVVIETAEPQLAGVHVHGPGCAHNHENGVFEPVGDPVPLEGAPEAVAEDVLDKEKGRCINCLDTGAIAGDPDQVCDCPAGSAVGHPD
jgi:hypothetical protein